jgi:cytochrome P450
MIVLNTYEAAMSMLNRKGTIYSDRPSLYFVAEMIGWKESTTLSNQGPRWKEHRRMFAQQLGSQGAVERFTPMLESRTREFIRQVMDDPSPEMLLRHIRT